VTADAGARGDMGAAPIRIGTRGSRLALVQAHLVADALASAGTPAEIVIVETEGDRRAPDTAWGEGAFVTAIERALRSEAVDLAVHSAKDVPTAEDPQLGIVAFLPRVEPRDAIVLPAGSPIGSLADLPTGSRVGTDSPRRRGFLLARRPDLLLHPLHGNVDTRLRKLDGGESDALVLAAAGLTRLGCADRITELLDPELLPSAPGQGAIAIQVRRDDARTVAAASALDHRATRIAVEAERSFLRWSGGGCRAPIGALATVEGDQMRIVGGYAATDGSLAAIEIVTGPAADGERLVDELVERLSRAAPGVVSLRNPAATLPGPP